MVKKEDCTQSNDSNSSLSSNSSSSSSFVNNSQVNTDKTSSMQNLANQLVAAAVGNGNSILCAAPSGQSEVAQVYFQNDLANPYKLQAAAVHLINQAAQQHQTSGSKDIAREKRSENRLANNISSSSSSGSNNGNEIVEVAQETNRKREIRLLKNREAARECRRKKKEYIKCLENRVAVLETQNKTLIEELKTLKELYCQTGENTNSNKNSSNSHSNSSSSQQSAASSKA